MGRVVVCTITSQQDELLCCPFRHPGRHHGCSCRCGGCLYPWPGRTWSWLRRTRSPWTWSGLRWPRCGCCSSCCPCGCCPCCPCCCCPRRPCRCCCPSCCPCCPQRPCRGCCPHCHRPQDCADPPRSPDPSGRTPGSPSGSSRPPGCCGHQDLHPHHPPRHQPRPCRWSWCRWSRCCWSLQRSGLRRTRYRWSCRPRCCPLTRKTAKKAQPRSFSHPVETSIIL